MVRCVMMMMMTLFKHDEVFSRAGGVMYLEIKNK